MENKLLSGNFSPRENRVLHSNELFGDDKLVLIRHKEDLYRLSITKQGKLILTK